MKIQHLFLFVAYLVLSGCKPQGEIVTATQTNNNYIYFVSNGVTSTESTDYDAGISRNKSSEREASAYAIP